MSGETNDAATNKPASPRDSEDLFSVLRTRWSDGVFSDIKVAIFGREYSLHRVVLCRSTFFDNLLRGDWNETNDKVLNLQIPSSIITCEGFELSLSHMYANPVMLNRNNVLQVIAAASYLGLQDLYAQGTEYVLGSLHDPELFCKFYCEASSLEYGPHAEKIQKAGWRLLCMMGVDHLRQVLPHLDTNTLKKLLQCDEFWIKTELERYNLVKEILFPKLIQARALCKEHGGTTGMPIWSDPTGGSPREPWILSHNEADTFTRSGGGSSNIVFHNQTLDSAEIREYSPGSNESHQDLREINNKQNELDPPNLQNTGGPSAIGRKEASSSSPFPATDDHSSQDENVNEQRVQDDRLSPTEAKDVVPNTQKTAKQFQTFDSNQQNAVMSIEEAVNEVNGILDAISGVLGSEGIRYSHIQHEDLCKIELELVDHQLSQVNLALLQGIRTQAILYRRIEACSVVEEQELQGGRAANFPVNLYPYNAKETEELYSRWVFPSFRFGVEFADVKNIEPQTEQISDAHFYAGSIWKVRLLIDDDQNEVRLHLFRNQRKVGKIGGVHTPHDPREVVCTRFKFLVPSKEGIAARSSRPGRFQQKKGRGWNDFLRLDNLDKYITPWGSLRIIVVVHPPFESD